MIDWLASGFLLAGTLLLSRKRRSGWLFNCTAAILWGIFGYSVQSFALIFMEIVFAVLALRGYALWRGGEQ